MAYAASWNALTNSGSRYWSDVACSADGTQVVAIVGEAGFAGYIYTSTDSGASWTQRATSVARFSVCCSDDFSVQLASSNSSATLERSTDSGATWATVKSGYLFTGVCCTPSGAIQYAAAENSKIWKSTDSGATWSQLTGSTSKTWQRIACSSDGLVVLATAFGSTERVYLSTNGGANWATTGSMVSCQGCAVSADGTRLFVGRRDGSAIYVSSDGGANWVTITPPATYPVWDISCSDDGRYVVAGGLLRVCLVSEDYGASWTTAVLLAGSNLSINGTAMAADGSVIYAVGTSTSAWAANPAIPPPPPSSARLTRLVAESLSTSDPLASLSGLAVEVLSSSLEASAVSVSRMNLEVLVPIVATSVSRVTLEALVPFDQQPPTKRRKHLWVIT